MDLKEENILGVDIQNHWYYESKAKSIMLLLSQKEPSIILDVGAGSGFFSRYLLKNSSAKKSWCVDISYEDDRDELEQEKPIYFRRSIESVDADLILLMDVLEHVDDDICLLKQYVQLAPLGTRFIISVPAFEFLWSGHDVFLDHKRRYRLSQLEEVIKQSGLTIKLGAYYFGAVFPIAATIRLFQNYFYKKSEKNGSQLQKHHSIINKFLLAICSAELYFFQKNRLCGLSIICMAEKR